MFEVLEISLQVLEQLVPVERAIKRMNRSLGDQVSRASESIALNLGEGQQRQAGDRRRHWEMAAGSASELTVALRIARAKQYVGADELAPIEASLDRARAMLYRLTHRAARG